VVDIFLGALALVAGSQQTTSRVRVLTSLKTGGLGVVVVAITITLRNVLQDDSPVALNIDSPGDLSVIHVTGTKVALRSNPVGGIIGRGSLTSPSVVGVVKSFLLFLGDVLDQVIGRLVSNVSILLQEKSVLRDLMGNIIGWVLRIKDTIRKVTSLSTLWGSLRVTVAMVRSRSRVGWCIRSRSRCIRSWGVGESCPDNSSWKDD